VNAHQRWTLAAVCVSTTLLLVNVAAPNVALEAIAKDLDASFTDLQWVLSGYSLVLAVFQLTAGSLADLFGRKRLFVGGLCLFTFASGLCALAPSAGWLIAARALQGLGAAIVFPSSLALLAHDFEGAQRGRAIGIWGAVIGLAFAGGPLIGGVLVEPFGWQAIFALGVVFGVPTIVFAVRQVSESRDPDPKPVDWPGVVTLSIGLFLIVFAVLRGNAMGWTSTPVVGLVGAGAAFLAAFVAVELRVTAPMLDLRLFRNRTFLGATVIVASLSAGSFGAFVYLSLFMLDVRRGTPVEVGLWLAPLAVVAFAVSLAAGRLSHRVPLRGALVLGMSLTAAGLLLLTRLDPESSWLDLLAGLVVVGAGIGLANPLVTFAHLGVLPPAQGGLASGINSTARQLGLAVGIAVLGALLQSHIAGRVEERTDGLGAARGAVTDRIADGDVAAATQLAPPAARESLRATYDAAFASGLNELMLISVGLALAGLAASLVLVRTRDLWRAPGV
jgi:EmrB/QacA subfamily drug resistance transporter